MKGKNEMLLNEATMIEITQQWLDRQLTGNAPVVTSVKHEGGDRYCNTFKVSLDSEADRPGPKAATS